LAEYGQPKKCLHERFCGAFAPAAALPLLLAWAWAYTQRMRQFPIDKRILSSLAAVALLAVATLWLWEPRVARLWLGTLGLASGASFIALPLGTMAAILMYKTDAPGRWVASLIFVGMLFVPLYLVAGAWDAGFGIQGWHTLTSNPRLAHEPWLDGWRAVIWVHALAAVPWVVLIVGAGLRLVEAEIEEDAATCATPARVLVHVTLPRAVSALVVAVLWVAIVATAEISATDLFQVRTFAEEVYTQAALGAIDFSGEQRAESSEFAVGLWIGLIISVLLAIAAIAAASRTFANFGEAPQRSPWVWRLGALRWPASILLWLVLVLVVGVPLGNLMYKAGLRAQLTASGPVRDWSLVKAGERLGAAPTEFRGDLWLSGRIGAAAATAALCITLPLAWSMRQPARIPWLRLTMLSLCLTIPGPLLGVALIRLLNQPPESPLAFLAPLYDTNFGPWLVQTVRGLPLATLILWPALVTVPQATLDTAATEGVGWWGRLLRIALPQRLPAIAAAWLVGLAIALGELAATVLVVPPQRSTPIAVRVFQLLHYGVDDRMAAISLVMVASIAALTGIAAVLLQRK
jgi:iron(III) transport system permease protein